MIHHLFWLALAATPSVVAQIVSNETVCTNSSFNWVSALLIFIRPPASFTRPVVDIQFAGPEPLPRCYGSK